MTLITFSRDALTARMMPIHFWEIHGILTRRLGFRWVVREALILESA